MSFCRATRTEAKPSILVLGVGGLGCEIAHALILAGFSELCLVDPDKVELSNLNRQFMYGEQDVGRLKVEAATEFLSRMCPDSHLSIETVASRVEQLPVAFFACRPIVMNAVDTVQTRRYVNALLRSNETGIKIVIDGGTEGCSSTHHVYAKGRKPCYECTLELLPSMNRYPVCSIRGIPQSADQCVVQALNEVLDDSYDEEATSAFDATPLEEKVLQLAMQKRDTRGISEPLSMALVHEILGDSIPACSSTNSVAAALMVSELLNRLNEYDGDTEITVGDTSTGEMLTNSKADDTLFFSTNLASGAAVSSWQVEPACVSCLTP